MTRFKEKLNELEEVLAESKLKNLSIPKRNEKYSQSRNKIEETSRQIKTSLLDSRMHTRFFHF